MGKMEMLEGRGGSAYDRMEDIRKNEKKATEKRAHANMQVLVKMTKQF